MENSVAVSPGPKWEAYKAACQDYTERWALLDQVLYDLCAKHPTHQTAEEVDAKLWIIGRTYATGIERRVAGQNGVQGGALERVAQHMIKNGGEIDSILASLAGIQEPLDLDKLAAIVAAHGQFVSLLKQITTKGRAPRSFASKYLHFHHPAVPIYDSYVVVTLGRLYARQKLDALVEPIEADADYVWYVKRFWRLYQEARTSPERVSVKLLDHFLLTAC